MLPDRIDNEHVPVWDQPTWPRVWQSGLSVVGAAAVGIACFFGGDGIVMPTGSTPDITPPPVIPPESIIPSDTGVVLFQCDWDDIGDVAEVMSCGAGAAYSWDIQATTNDTAVQVVDATDNGLSTSWPNDRAYLVRCQDRGGNGCARNAIRTRDAFPNPVAGDTVAYRLSRAVSSDVMKGTGNMDEHGFKFASGGLSTATTGTMHIQVDVTDATWTFSSNFQGPGSSWPDGKWCAVLIGQTGGCNGGNRATMLPDYGYEVHYLYSFPSDTSYILEAIRVYDIPGDSLMTDWEWQNLNGSATLPSPEVWIDTTSARGWRWNNITLGHSANAEFSFRGTGERLFYVGGFAVCKNTWCPRYGGLPGEN